MQVRRLLLPQAGVRRHYLVYILVREQPLVATEPSEHSRRSSPLRAKRQHRCTGEESTYEDWAVGCGFAEPRQSPPRSNLIASANFCVLPPIKKETKELPLTPWLIETSEMFYPLKWGECFMPMSATDAGLPLGFSVLGYISEGLARI